MNVLRRVIPWAILLAALLVLPAAYAAVDGHVQVGYDAYTGDWHWEVEISQPIYGDLTAGVTLGTYCPQYLVLLIVPAWVPTVQTYSIWLEYAWGPWSARLAQWCNHYLAQSYIPATQDTCGLGVRLRYDF